MTHTNVVTIDQALADGTSPAALLDVAKHAPRQEAQELRRIAHHIADRMGYSLRGRRGANDNTRVRRGKAA